MSRLSKSCRETEVWTWWTGWTWTEDPACTTALSDKSLFKSQAELLQEAGWNWRRFLLQVMRQIFWLTTKGVGYLWQPEFWGMVIRSQISANLGSCQWRRNPSMLGKTWLPRCMTRTDGIHICLIMMCFPVMWDTVMQTFGYANEQFVPGLYVFASRTGRSLMGRLENSCSQRQLWRTIAGLVTVVCCRMPSSAVVCCQWQESRFLERLGHLVDLTFRFLQHAAAGGQQVQSSKCLRAPKGA